MCSLVACAGAGEQGKKPTEVLVGASALEACHPPTDSSAVAAWPAAEKPLPKASRDQTSRVVVKAMGEVALRLPGMHDQG